MMRSKTALLLGSYGQTNLGDDLLMWNYLELLKEKGFTTLYVNANTVDNIPEPIKKAYPGLKIVETYKTSLVGYIRLMRKVEVIVYGGGTLYKELYSSTGRSPYGVIIRLMVFNLVARAVGAKVYHLNIGIGSLKTWIGKMITKVSLLSSAKTIFRDQKSYDIASDVLNIPSGKIEKSTDGIFLNHIWEKPWRKASLQKVRGRTVVGVNVLSDIPDWVDREEYIAQMRQFVTNLLNKDFFVVFMPFQHDFNPRNDLVFTQEVFGDILDKYDNYTIIEGAPIDTVTSYLRQCSVFVGMRLHSLLLATVAQVPFVGVAYDTKCLRFMRESQYDHFVEIEKLSADVLMDKTEFVLENQKEISDQLKAIASKNYKEAEETLRKLPF